MSKQDWQELAFSLAIGTLMIVALFVYLLLLPHSKDSTDATKFRSEPSDYSLMTEQEKVWAMESGIGTYELGGIYYIDENLPSEYWED